MGAASSAETPSHLLQPDTKASQARPETAPSRVSWEASSRGLEHLPREANSLLQVAMVSTQEICWDVASPGRVVGTFLCLWTHLTLLCSSAALQPGDCQSVVLADVFGSTVLKRCRLAYKTQAP